MKRSLPFRTIVISLVGLIVLLVVADITLSKLALRKLKSVFEQAGITVRTVNVDLVTRSVSLKGFEWRTEEKTDSLTEGNRPKAFSKVQISIETIRASWINVLALVRNKEVNIGSLTLAEGKIVADRRLPDKTKNNNSPSTEESPQTRHLPFNHLSIGTLSIKNVELIVRQDTITEHRASVDLTLHNAILAEPDRLDDVNAYTLDDFDIAVKAYKMTAQRSMYTLDVKAIAFNSKSKELTLESIALIPRYGKYKFSRRLGKQFDRFVLRVPKVELTGLDISKIRDSIITASSLKIKNADLYVFRDKRLPFIKHNDTPLPVELIRKLRFGFALDSLLLVDTKIKYEEFPEKGFQTGYILFDNLQANVAKVTNRDFYPGHKQSVLHVTSRVMQNGTIKVDFTLPYDKAQVYNAKGRISNLRLETLNPMLESLAFVKVESGRLNALDFDFSYDNVASRGNLLVNYENLKIAGLTKDKQAKENDVKSFALNLFVKKDKGKEVPVEKRSGKIYYERDQRRAVFNVWVKSLFSGVKSSVVDPPSERKPQTRKEKRDSIRHLRKENREKKKKERQEEKNEKRTEKSDSVNVITSRI
ncbi:DUF748 domain-containing protein [Chryseolinea sp. T2]|uniref:DUF748 domain-containing protein n=1 Tax=Chryseolinea sp. T2 TaxID=3129255 RepID=UPI003076D191